MFLYILNIKWRSWLSVTATACLFFLFFLKPTVFALLTARNFFPPRINEKKIEKKLIKNKIYESY